MEYDEEGREFLESEGLRCPYIQVWGFIRQPSPIDPHEVWENDYVILALNLLVHRIAEYHCPLVKAVCYAATAHYTVARFPDYHATIVVSLQALAIMHPRTIDTRTTLREPVEDKKAARDLVANQFSLSLTANSIRLTTSIVAQNIFVSPEPVTLDHAATHSFVYRGPEARLLVMFKLLWATWYYTALA
ncbi:uncharacterized protein CLUP02_12329 [Colletotrichum lupini]|uniref:Uncharacterized protein n=1 Tax=Colletotrichum lupini TaxID=145971 RepID=A0A9Q8WL54_9PEZI|nr:uncharacterized protein CLUP02_12329 [Colletotrichum lupini]UQC86827.1 hypothetical protein CLUP02_12329 [Colletotrichum lupini]